MSDILSGISALPPYGIAAVIVMLLYAIQSEVRFGKKARTHRTGASDRKSTLVVSIVSGVPVIGFVLQMKASSSGYSSILPEWFGEALLPGLPAIAWIGVALGALGLAIRLWAVLTLRERYTRTLLVQDDQAVERDGPYRWVRHPGYLGSLLCLNGIALASGNKIVLAVSLLATFAAYAYRVRVEDEMLVVAFGPSYDDYRRQVPALVPFLRPSRTESA